MNANDLWAFTPLHEASSKSRVEVCSLLLSEGADPTQLNCHSKSAIDVAPTRELQERLACECRLGFFCVMSYLIEYVLVFFVQMSTKATASWKLPVRRTRRKSRST